VDGQRAISLLSSGTRRIADLLNMSSDVRTLASQDPDYDAEITADSALDLAEALGTSAEL
jgi:hypothetical protein